MEPVIKWIKKNIFWIGCAFLAIAMIATWFFASNSIADQTDKFQKNIKSNISKANAILNVTASDLAEEGVTAHPNSTSEEGMKQELSKTIDAIVEAWKIRKQAQEKILVWPGVIPNQEVKNVFGRFDPPETFPEEWEGGYGFEEPLKLYGAKIPEQMVYLCGDDVLRANWKYDPANKPNDRIPTGRRDETGDLDEDRFGAFAARGGQAPGRGDRMGSEFVGEQWFDENDYAVIWSDVNQELWHQKLTDFQGRDDNNRETNHPTPLQCYMLQQDMWLLEAMFRIIREVNGNSDANDLSAIKRIDHILFGREAGGKLGELTPPDLRLAGDSTEEDADSTEFGGRRGDMRDEEAMFDRDMDERSESSGRMGPGMTDKRVPYDERYVDLNFEPLPAEVVRAVITGQELPEENLELIVAKRVPVRIALRMDERKIDDFMAACANSPFAFEIQQVRWNKHTPGGESIMLGGSSQLSGTRGGPGRSSGRTGMTGMMPSMSRGGRGGSDAVTISPSKPVEIRTSHDVDVEFIGIVKIYNPVREKLLRRAAGLEEDTIDPSDAADASQTELKVASSMRGF